MNDMNLTILTGRLTADPILRTTKGGKNVTSFSIAVNKKWGEIESVSFINCIAWDKQGEWIAADMKKGSGILVHGEIQTRSWEADGAKKYATEINVKYFRNLNHKKNPEAVADNFDTHPIGGSPFSDNDIPF